MRGIVNVRARVCGTEQNVPDVYLGVVSDEKGSVGLF